jgi:hypothetical protein
LEKKLEKMEEQMNAIDEIIQPLFDSGKSAFDGLQAAWTRLDRTISRRVLQGGGDATPWKKSWIAFHISARDVFDKWIGEDEFKEGECFGNVNLYSLFKLLESLPLAILGKDWENQFDEDCVESLGKHRRWREEAKSMTPQELTARYARNKVKKAADARRLREKESGALYSAGRPGKVGTINTMSEIPEVLEEGSDTIQSSKSKATVVFPATEHDVTELLESIGFCKHATNTWLSSKLTQTNGKHLAVGSATAKEASIRPYRRYG